MKNFEISSLELLPQAAQWVLENLSGNKVVAFYGDMGVGKTTLIKSMCDLLGCKSNVSSPTFAIINEYPLTEKSSIFHFDLYRIQKFNELLDIGAEEYFYSGNYCFIEWPEIAEPVLPDNCVKINVKLEANLNRQIAFIV